MLKLSFVSNVSNATVTYDADLTYFSYNVKNNEMVAFQATVPTLSATIKLITVDQHIKAIKRGDLLTVQNADGTGASLPLRAVEVTTVPRKGLSEISCSGPFITQTNDIWGTLLIPAGSLSDTKTAYGLSMLHEGADTQNGEMFLNVDKKSDLLLGIAWSYPELRNLAIMPFVGGGSSSGPFSSGEGIAMFENAKPGNEGDNLPIYYVDPGDIVDYDISPAQPPVTHLRTSDLGVLGPTPQIPAIQVLKRSGTPGSSDIHDSVRAYYVQGKSLAALWVAQEDTSGNLVSQTLYWSDGVSQTWVGGSRKRIVGIFDDSYLETADSNTALWVRDRVNDTILRTISTGSSQYSWRDQTPYLPGLTVFFNKRSDTGGATDCQIFVMPKPVRETGYTYTWGVVKRGVNYFTTSFSTGGVNLSSPNFAGACRVYNSPGNKLSVFYTDVVLHPGGDDSKVSMAIYSIQASITSALSNTSAGISTVYTKPGSKIDDILFMGAVDCDASGPLKAAYVLVRLEYTPSGGSTSYQCFRLDLETTPSITAFFDADRMFWVAGEWDAYAHWYNYPVLKVKGDTWQLLARAQDSASVWQEGSLSEWSGSPITFYSLFAEAFVGETYKGDGVWEVYLQLSQLPFITRQPGKLSQSTQIAEGETNMFDLAFKVGAIQQVGQFEPDLGRISVRLASFSYSRYIYGNWHERQADTPHLESMAVGAYVKIALDPNDPSDVVIGKIVSFSFTYDGAVRTEIVAIIVG